MPAPAAEPARAAPPAAVGPSRSAPLDQLLAGDMAPDGAIPWSTARPLRWADFQGPPPSGGPEAARTAYGLFFGWKCRGRAFEFLVTAAFLPKQSWVKAVTMQDSVESRRTLRHEQTHFDVSELHARHMRQFFQGLADPCARTDDQLNVLARRFVTEEQAMQRRYDEETTHGLLATPQSGWNREVARQLAALSRYAR